MAFLDITKSKYVQLIKSIHPSKHQGGILLHDDALSPKECWSHVLAGHGCNFMRSFTKGCRMLH